MGKASNNINKIVDLVERVLHSRGKAKSADKDGNIFYVDLNIYDRDMLIAFIALSLSNFNQIPPFTFFTFKYTKFIDLFAEILVEGATLYALGSQALIERGREFQMIDGGVSFTPPTVSELLNTQYCTLLDHHFAKVKHIKSEIGSLKFPSKK